MSDNSSPADWVIEAQEVPKGDFIAHPKSQEDILRATRENMTYDDSRMLNTLPSVVAKAIKNGFVKLGYDYLDYMREAIKGIPLGDYEGAPRKKGYVESLYWQEAGCLVKDTQIQVFEDLHVENKALSDLPFSDKKVNNWFELLSFNEITKSTELDFAVINYAGKKDVFRIETKDGAILASEEHPFLTEKGWKQTKQLSTSDYFYPKEAKRKVKRIEAAGKEDTYDLHVNRNHNFFLSQEIVSHNSGKSNLAIQHGFRLLAGEPEDRDADFDEDKYWNYVIMEQTVMDETGLQRIYKEITQRGPTDPIPWVNVDDVTTSIPKHLWFQKGGINKFSKLHQFIAVIRPYIKVLCFSSPFPENLISVLSENLKMEIIVYPNSTYMVERYVRDVDPRNASASILRKIVIEYSAYNLDAIPKDWWDKYEARRFAITQKVARELEEAGGTTVNEQEIKENKARILRESLPSNSEVESYLRSKGIKFDSHFAQAFTHAFKELSKKRAGITGLENSDLDEQ